MSSRRDAAAGSSGATGAVTSADGPVRSPARTALAAQLAERYYLRGHSKIQIAEEFGLSRFKVARLLDAASAEGLVRVEIRVPEPIDLHLSDRLRASYGLNCALVLRRVPGQDDESALGLRRRLAELAADLLSEIVVPGDVLGLAWARTVNVMVESLPKLARCSVVQLCGVHSRMDMRDSSVETVARAAAISGGAAYPIYAPLVLPDGRTGETLRRQRGIAEAFEAFGSLTKAVVSVGAWQPDQSTVYDVIEREQREALAADGVTAEMSAQLFDASGRVLSTGLRHHVLAIDAEQLRRVPEVVALAGGTAKVGAIDAVLRSGIVTTMITDADAAEGLLERAATDPPSSRASDRTPPGVGG